MTSFLKSSKDTTSGVVAVFISCLYEIDNSTNLIKTSYKTIGVIIFF
jgi:hypothetical protein